MSSVNELRQQMLNVYSGILYNDQVFEEGNDETFVYDFSCPEFNELLSKYKLAEIAGEGTDFFKAKNLLHYLAPRLTHSSWYANHIECNSLSLLEYSLENPSQGINCLNKSKIFVECCLAIGIYARRVSILPYSPYDFDHHVVTEIYDKQLEKWIMLDPTTDGYFIDSNKLPLSLLEMRNKFASAEFITYVSSTEELKDIHELSRKYIDKNMYISKNLYYFQVDQYSTFGEKGKHLYFVPKDYSIKKSKEANLKYRLDNLPSEYEMLRNMFLEEADKLKSSEEPERSSIKNLIAKPFNL